MQLCVHDNYRNNPFHNFRHCFCVTQMMYSMIGLCGLQVGCGGAQDTALHTMGKPQVSSAAPPSPWARLLPGSVSRCTPTLLSLPGDGQVPPTSPALEGASSSPYPFPPQPSPLPSHPTLSLIQEKFSQMDILTLMTAAICHDLDHPGYNNTYVRFPLSFPFKGRPGYQRRASQLSAWTRSKLGL